MEHNLNLQFSSSIRDVVDINESFSSGRMRVCYVGLNKNKSNISKASVERAIPTMFNCPVVCNYDIESDSIGGHDVDVVCDQNGILKIVNLTSAVGVIPSEATYGWEIVDDDGVEHEYFWTDVILWKRSPAYPKISEDGITGQSMEITVKEGSVKNEIFIVDDFVFTAFCLLGDNVTPCFESASLQMFSNNNELKVQFSKMMREFKETFTNMQASNEEDMHTEFCVEGGDSIMDAKKDLMAKFGITEDMLDFKLEDFSVEELEEKFASLKNFADTEDDDPADNDEAASDDVEHEDSDASEDDSVDIKKKVFSLNRDFVKELCRVLEAEKIDMPWGKEPRYCFVDYDADVMEVYCEDSGDRLLYGFSYSRDGDSVIIDWESRKRKKYIVADFVGSEQSSEFETPAPFSTMYSKMVELYNTETADLKAKYQKANNDISEMSTELEILREYKAKIESDAEDTARDALFSQFDDLIGVEAFESLQQSAKRYSIEELEEKCFALRGRKNTALKFSIQSPKAPRLPVERHLSEDEGEPYGGVFREYGIK